MKLDNVSAAEISIMLLKIKGRKLKASESLRADLTSDRSNLNHEISTDVRLSWKIKMMRLEADLILPLASPYNYKNNIKIHILVTSYIYKTVKEPIIGS